MNKKNAGFSLVELIVVIAIMAVLVGVLAPAYLKYVEKSRKSSDISSISDMLFAADKVAVDVQFSVPADTEFVLSIDEGEVTLTCDVADAQTEWISIAGDYTCKSSEFQKDDNNVTITGVVGDDGSVAYYADYDNAIIKYSNDFKNKLIDE